MKQELHYQKGKLDNLITLGELAKELGIFKSKLAYYTSLGLLKPTQVIGKTMVFKKDKALNTIQVIKQHQKKGKKLVEIKKLLK